MRRSEGVVDVCNSDFGKPLASVNYWLLMHTIQSFGVGCSSPAIADVQILLCQGSKPLGILQELIFGALKFLPYIEDLVVKLEPQCFTSADDVEMRDPYSGP